MITTKQTGQWARFCLRLLLPCLLAGGGLAGCTEEVPVANQEQGQPVMMSIGSRAINADKPGEGIRMLRILLVNPNNIDQTVVCNRFVNNPTDNPLKIQVVSGTYDVYVVANESFGSRENNDLKNVRNLADLKKIRRTFEPSEITMENNNIPMFGIVKNVNIIAPEGEPSESNLAKITVNGSDNGTILPVSLTRLLCKINVTLKYSSGTPKNVCIENLPYFITLFDETENTYGNNNETPRFLSTSVTDDPLYPNMTEVEDMLLPCWAFTPKDNIEKAPILMVTMKEGSETRLYRSVIGHAAGSSDNPKDYTLWRNYDYKLTAIITNNTVSVGASVTKWKDETLSLEGGDPATPTP